MEYGLCRSGRMRSAGQDVAGLGIATGPLHQQPFFASRLALLVVAMLLRSPASSSPAQ
jgi:hypothetical protein